MSELFDSIPDISFTDNISLEELTNLFLTEYKDAYRKITGTDVLLEKTDPFRVLIQAQSCINYQIVNLIEKAGRMNFLKYAENGYLDNLGVFKNRFRKERKAAKVEVAFYIEETLNEVEIIPVGTLVTADQKVFFETMENAEIHAGEKETVVLCTCTESGVVGNGFEVGEISTLATPTGHISRVMNVTRSYGGEDTESDEELRNGIFESPYKYSVAGPENAYISIVKDYNSDVADVLPYSEDGSGICTIVILMKNGRIPNDDELRDIEAYLNMPDKKMLGIKVVTKAPEIFHYNLDLTYYIAESDKDRVTEIKDKVNREIEKYVNWQGGSIGIDINPDELIYKIRKTGAKRAVIKEPIFTKISSRTIAKIQNCSAVYGGMEDD